ncbi:MAG: YicC/YloC family endoribonuclease, partial [Candidatus Riflebacteria bacterium]
MISSLTGFGRASLTDEAGRVSVELKSVNNRFLQID